MNLTGLLLGGLLGTAVMTILMTACQGLRLSRMSLPYLVGTIFAPNRDLAMPIGFAVHFVNGWAAALIYALFFEHVHPASWWFGGALGLVHGLVVFVALMPVLPGLHPRMASERQGPEPTRALEPPGMLALHYGSRTPTVGITAHVIYGVILGAVYAA